jgi:hypothetical protein
MSTDSHGCRPRIRPDATPSATLIREKVEREEES